MPAMFPAAIAMAFELAVYGGMAGLLYSRLPRKKWMIYAALLISMIAGRVVWGAVQALLAGTLSYQPDYCCQHHTGDTARLCGSHTCSAACYHEKTEE